MFANILKILAGSKDIKDVNSSLLGLLSPDDAEAATIPAESTGGIMPSQDYIGTTQAQGFNPTESQPSQGAAPEAAPNYLGMLKQYFQPQKESKWDTILKRIQEGSGILHTLGGDNNALNNVVNRKQQQPAVNPLQVLQLQEQARHNRAMENKSSTTKPVESSMEKLKRATVPSMARSIVGKDKPGWFTGDYTPAEAIKEALKGFGGSSSSMSPQDLEALKWAKANPQDPRAIQILQQLGG